jgi:hypothetical protein
MALPDSGLLSFSMIAAELGVGTPNSLNSMSEQAGFSTPHAVSDFYGYSAGTVLTEFTATPVSNKFSENVCNLQTTVYLYHNGVGSIPAIGDTVYTDPAGTILAGWTFYKGFNDFEGPAYAAGTVSNGVITDVQYCLLF